MVIILNTLQLPPELSRDEIERIPIIFTVTPEEKEKYRFGDGGILSSFLRAEAPVVLCGRPHLIEFSVVPSNGLGLLLGRDLFER